VSLFVRFWGTRGSIPTPGPSTRKYGGNTSCVEIRSGEDLIICDGGSGLRDLGLDLLKRGSKPVVGHMFFSHPHWDHIQGFPFFAPVYLPASTLYVYGASKGDRRFHDLLSGQMRSDYFPVDFSELRASIEARDLDASGGEVGPVKVRTFGLEHPGGAIAYSFEREGRKVVYATDNELDRRFPVDFDARKDKAARRPVPQDYVDFVAGADLLIADSQYTDDEYPQKAGWGHSRAFTVVDAALLAKVGQLALFHHDPMHSDQDLDRLVGESRERAAATSRDDFVVFGAREGLELRIG
jgi:phosphoribosyl 1,2-cyclic phosphodiesterase